MQVTWCLRQTLHNIEHSRSEACCWNSKRLDDFRLQIVIVCARPIFAKTPLTTSWIGEETAGQGPGAMRIVFVCCTAERIYR